MTASSYNTYDNDTQITTARNVEQDFLHVDTSMSVAQRLR